MTGNDFNDFGNNGGFMADDPNTASAGRGDARENRVIVSVNINQLLNLNTKHGFVMHRQKIGLVRFIGRLLKINEQSTKINYSVTDGTAGEIDVSYYLVNDEKRILMENSYVKVIGQPRSNPDGSVYIIAYAVLPLESLNEYAVHWLEVMDHANYFQKQKSLLEYGGKTDVDMEVGTVGRPSYFSDFKDGSNNMMSEKHNLILNLIKQTTDDIGIGRQEIYDTINTLSHSEIDDSLNFLAAEGHIFTTSDDNHFKNTSY